MNSPFNHWFQKIIFLVALPLLSSGCGSLKLPSKDHLFFKAQVVQVKYMLAESKTILVDSEGKETVLDGLPGIPCANVEIYQIGEHEYEVVVASR